MIPLVLFPVLYRMIIENIQSLYSALRRCFGEAPGPLGRAILMEIIGITFNRIDEIYWQVLEPVRCKIRYTDDAPVFFRRETVHDSILRRIRRASSLALTEYWEHCKFNAVMIFWKRDSDN